MAEGDEPPPPPPQATILEAFQHFACLYIKYIQIYKRLEMCYDAMVHPQKRIDVKVTDSSRKVRRGGECLEIDGRKESLPLETRLGAVPLWRAENRENRRRSSLVSSRCSGEVAWDAISLPVRWRVPLFTLQWSCSNIPCITIR